MAPLLAQRASQQKDLDEVTAQKRREMTNDFLLVCFRSQVPTPLPKVVTHTLVLSSDASLRAVSG